MILALLIAATLLLGYSNGANDNFKGVATLYGSRTLGYRSALTLATISTLCGSVASIIVAGGLIKAFSGGTILSGAAALEPVFLTSVAAGAAVVVLFATLIGYPVSTTHALVGSLAGAGFASVGADVELATLSKAFLLPLLLSPLISLILSYWLYRSAHKARARLGIARELCVCVGGPRHVVPLGVISGTKLLEYGKLKSIPLDMAVDTRENCFERYGGSVLGVELQRVVDVMHLVSAASVCFARALNDTPKIVALLVVVKGLEIEGGMVAVALAMALGGVLNARKVAARMSRQITPINHGQGLTANIVTALLVIVASRYGVPVSTTHVSVGSIFGIGTYTGKADKGVINSILLAWFFTLPLGAAAAFVSLNLLSSLTTVAP